MKIKNILLATIAFLALAGCGGGDYSPKPKAYLRIDLPERAYILCDTQPLPFTFECSKAAQISIKKRELRDVWVDIAYPQWNGVAFLTYKQLAGKEDLRGQTDTSSRLLEKHYQFASGIDERGYEDAEHKVYGTVWHLRGSKVASTYQFFATDSARHFLRGALYINSVPNNDSLAPVLEYMQRDIDHLVETLRWR